MDEKKQRDLALNTFSELDNPQSVIKLMQIQKKKKLIAIRQCAVKKCTAFFCDKNIKHQKINENICIIYEE